MMEDFKTKYFYFFVPYGFFISILYLWTFWSHFNIDIFQYISIHQIIISTIYPLTGSLIIYLLVALFFESESSSSTESINEKSVVKKIFRFLFLSFVFCYDAYFFAFFVFLDILPTQIAKIIIKYDLQDRLNLNLFHLKMISFSIFLSIAAWNLAAHNSDRILNNERVQFVNSDLLGIKNSYFSEDQVKYIGYSGDSYFFISKDNSKTFIVNRDTTPYLMIDKPILQYSNEWFIERLWKRHGKKLFGKDSPTVPIEGDDTKQKSGQDATKTS